MSGGAPINGLIAGAVGLGLGMIGMDPQSGRLRWVMGELYLWDGIPLVPVTLGIFAIPELVGCSHCPRLQDSSPSRVRILSD